MNESEMWEDDSPVTEKGIAVPDWINQGISPADVAAIVQGGCASGAYMPAVVYFEALATMADHGDDVLQYLQDNYGELPRPRDDESWSGMACFYLSAAVELWASSAAAELENWEPEEA